MWCGVTTRKVAWWGCSVAVVCLVFGRRLALVGHRMFLSSFTLAAAITTCSHTRGRSSMLDSGVTMGWLLRLVTGGPTGGKVRKVATPLRELTCHMGSHSVGEPDSSRVLSD